MSRGVNALKNLMASKLQERIYLDWLIKNQDLVYDSIQETERPDFILEHNDLRIGIEIVNYYAGHRSKRRGSIKKRLESHRNKWVQELIEEYYKNSDIPIYVNMSVPLSYPSYRDFANEIMPILLRSNELKVGNFEHYRIDSPKGVIKLRVYRLPTSEDFKHYSRWQCINDHIGWYDKLVANDDRITSIISEKEDKIETYIQRCDEIWLVIVADAIWTSGMARYFGEERLNMETRFKQVWFLEYPHKVYQLHVG